MVSLSTQTKVMRCALEAMGSVQALADCLQVKRIDAVNWIAGREQPPEDAFLRAVDIMLAHFKYHGPQGRTDDDAPDRDRNRSTE